MGPSGAMSTVVVPEGKWRASGSQAVRRRTSAAGLARRCSMSDRHVCTASSIGPAGPRSTCMHWPAPGQHEAYVAGRPAPALLSPDLRVVLGAVERDQVEDDGAGGEGVDQPGGRALRERPLAGELGDRRGQRRARAAPSRRSGCGAAGPGRDRHGRRRWPAGGGRAGGGRRARTRALARVSGSAPARRVRVAWRWRRLRATAALYRQTRA